MMAPLVYRCGGCGTEVPVASLVTTGLRCPRAGRDRGVDHVLEPRREVGVRPRPDRGQASIGVGTQSPFIRYRDLLGAWHLAMEAGWSEERYADLVERLDAGVTTVDGHGFAPTPFGRSDALSERLGFAPDGGLWVKNETINVSGSHKGRHLMAVMLYLEVAREVQGTAATAPPSLAIASCGNAALAAAVVSRAAGFDLSAFVPPDAATDVLARLRALGTRTVTCERRAGEQGDPCYLRFREAVDAGALPFCCQGPDNALTIEGGETLGWEIVDALDHRGLDRFCLQVGGGAFASSFVRAFRDALANRRLKTLPRLHAVQTLRAFPLARTWARVALRALDRFAPRPDVGTSAREALAALASTRADNEGAIECVASITPATLLGVGNALKGAFGWSDPDRRSALDELMQDAAHHRAECMTLWEVEPHSVAHGILDDETYDWRAVVSGMIASGGWPVLVTEAQVIEATTLGQTVGGIDVDPTGAAGFAGVLALGRDVGPHERMAVVFSGARRERAV